MINKTLSMRFDDLIFEYGLTYAQVAHGLEIASSSVWNLANGKRGASIELLEKIADFFCVSTDWLLGRTDERGQE